MSDEEDDGEIPPEFGDFLHWLYRVRETIRHDDTPAYHRFLRIVRRYVEGEIEAFEATRESVGVLRHHVELVLTMNLPEDTTLEHRPETGYLVLTEPDGEVLVFSTAR